MSNTKILESKTLHEGDKLELIRYTSELSEDGAWPENYPYELVLTMDYPGLKCTTDPSSSHFVSEKIYRELFEAITSRFHFEYVESQLGKVQNCYEVGIRASQHLKIDLSGIVENLFSDFLEYQKRQR